MRRRPPRLVIACLAAALPGCGRDLRPLPRVEGRPVRVACLGDSLTAGYGLGPARAFPALVQARLRARGLEVEVVNLGVSGDTTQDGLDRLAQVREAAPDLVLLALGANDGLRRMGVEGIRSRLGELVQVLHQEGVGVALAGVRLPVPLPLGYLSDFHEVFRGVAEAHEVALLPDLLAGVSGEPGRLLPDRVHPNAAGQEVMAEAVEAFLAPLVEAMGAAGGAG